ncbi:hypothetical protein BU23DRAFT_575073 [Bimuria novae-zelandiae CBS 107.79]|uniref:RING-type domain-containing protein n=1 Tax=Bimuria novae-zelandiae CBS 107.79 TaxID=1447943 RepID=A0A6A5UIZ3_9PLEO|nr:hypothetical protein BU23DRAFT_575073 [Bimuria novae-zelandiae CBS 107.79]
MPPYLSPLHIAHHSLPDRCEPTNGFLYSLSVTLGSCIPTNLALLSTILGTCSIISWLFAQLPQIYKNHKLKSTSGLSIFFLTEWLLGDVSNLLGSLFTQQATWQVIIASYYVSVDCALCGQWVWYGLLKHGRPLRSIWGRPRSSDSGNEPSGMDQVWTAPKVAKKADDNTVVPIPTDGLGLNANQIAGSPGRSSLHRSNPMDAFRIPNYGRSPSSTKETFIGTPPAGTPANRDVRRVAASSPPTFSPSPKTVLYISLILAVLSNTATATHVSPFAPAAYPSQHLSIQRQTAHHASASEITGKILSWMSTVLYLGSRLPQLYQNHIRKSTAGLSPTLFAAAFFGNLFYSTSLLTNPCAWHDFAPGEGAGWVDPEGSVRADWVLRATPFFLGAAGVLVMDAAVGVQFWYFGDNEPRGRGKLRDDEVLEIIDHGLRKNKRFRWRRVSGWMRGWVPAVSVAGTPSVSRATTPAETPRDESPASSSSQSIPIRGERGALDEARALLVTNMATREAASATGHGDPVAELLLAAGAFRSAAAEFRSAAESVAVDEAEAGNGATRCGEGRSSNHPYPNHGYADRDDELEAIEDESDQPYRPFQSQHDDIERVIRAHMSTSWRVGRADPGPASVGGTEREEPLPAQQHEGVHPDDQPVSEAWVRNWLSERGFTISTSEEAQFPVRQLVRDLVEPPLPTRNGFDLDHFRDFLSEPGHTLTMEAAEDLWDQLGLDGDDSDTPALPSREAFVTTGVVSLNVSPARSTDNCTICMEPIDVATPESREEAVVIQDCGHIYHRECVMEWFYNPHQDARYGTDPLCRQRLFINPGHEYDSDGELYYDDDDDGDYSEESGDEDYGSGDIVLFNSASDNENAMDTAESSHDPLVAEVRTGIRNHFDALRESRDRDRDNDNNGLSAQAVEELASIYERFPRLPCPNPWSRNLRSSSPSVLSHNSRDTEVPEHIRNYFDAVHESRLRHFGIGNGGPSAQAADGVASIDSRFPRLRLPPAFPVLLHRHPNVMELTSFHNLQADFRSTINRDLRHRHNGLQSRTGHGTEDDNGGGEAAGADDDMSLNAAPRDRVNDCEDPLQEFERQVRNITSPVYESLESIQARAAIWRERRCREIDSQSHTIGLGNDNDIDADGPGTNDIMERVEPQRAQDSNV